MKIKIEIDTGEANSKGSSSDVGGLCPADALDPLVIIGQGSLSTLYCQDPKHPGRIIARRPDGTLIDRTL